MHRSTLAVSTLVAASALAVASGEHDACACGGCFHPPVPPTQSVSDITDERMLLSVSPTQTTLYDQIEYAGTPSSFAWVLPINGTVAVGLSADVLFDSIDALTTTQITAPELNCPAPPSSCQHNGGCASAEADSAGFGAGSATPPSSVTVTKQQNVGPYETVQLKATDPTALNDWLAQNGFTIPADVTPVIDAYQSEGFGFLVMKLLPDQGVQAMRPVRVTMSGASLSLPLRMASVGTGALVGITVWVVSDGRYEPQNFPSFHIDDSQLVWDFATSSSNYTTLRAQAETASGNRAWEIESSIDVNEQLITNAIYSGGAVVGAGAAVGATSNAGDDYLPIVASSDDGGAGEGGADDGGVTESADQVRADDVAALLAGMSGPTVRITRIRSDISHAAMTADFALQASADQSELSNVRVVTQMANAQCAIYSSDCDFVGYGSPAQAAAQNGSGGGCAASARSKRQPLAGVAALFGVVAVVVARLARRRRAR